MNVDYWWNDYGTGGPQQGLYQVSFFLLKSCCLFSLFYFFFILDFWFFCEQLFLICRFFALKTTIVMHPFQMAHLILDTACIVIMMTFLVFSQNLIICSYIFHSSDIFFRLLIHFFVYLFLAKPVLWNAYVRVSRKENKDERGMALGMIYKKTKKTKLNNFILQYIQIIT